MDCPVLISDAAGTVDHAVCELLIRQVSKVRALVRHADWYTAGHPGCAL